MSEKLIAQMAVHLTDSEKESIQKLAVLRGISGDVISSDSSDSAPGSE